MLYQAMEAHTAEIKLTVGVDPTETYTAVYEDFTFKKGYRSCVIELKLPNTGGASL